MKLKLLSLVVFSFIVCQANAQDHKENLRGKTWYAIKQIKGEGNLDVEVMPEETNNKAFYFYFKIESNLAMRMLDQHNNSHWKATGTSPTRVSVKDDTLTILNNNAVLDVLEILRCDRDFLKLRDTNNVVYYFVTNSPYWEKKGRMTN